ncbi:membrane protein, partial [Chelonobacter oris]
MKKTAIALAISGLALASVAQAAPQANTFYAGAKAGWASFHDGLTQFEHLTDNNGVVRNTGHERNFVTYGVFGGYQITDYLAVELGYDDFGRAKLKYKGDTTAKHTAHGAHLTLKASYPVLTDLDVYARVGTALVRSDYKTYDSAFGLRGTRGHDLRASAVFAGGLEYAIIPSLALRVEYQWLNNVGKKSNSFSTDYRPDIGSVSAGLSYRFGQGVAAAPEIITKKFAFSSDVLFDFNKSSLKSGAEQALDGMTTDVAQSGLASPNYNVAGYTDR